MNKKNLLGIFLILSLWPVWQLWLGDWWSTLQAQKDTQIKQTQTIVTLKNSLDELKELSGTAQASQVQLVKQIPPQLDQEKIIRWIDKTTSELKLNLDNVQFSQGIHPEIATKQLLASFSLTGPRQTILEFLKKSESYQRFLGVQRLTLSESISFGSFRETTMQVNLYALSQESE